MNKAIEIVLFAPFRHGQIEMVTTLLRPVESTDIKWSGKCAFCFLLLILSERYEDEWNH